MKPDTYESMGHYVEVKDIEGIRYMKKFNIENDQVTSIELVKETELKEGDYAVPFKDWEGNYMEGIAYTLWDATRSLWKRDFDDLKHQLQNPTKKANFGLFIRDMIWTNIMM